MVEELSAVLEVYNIATEELHSFLLSNLMKADVNDIFHKRFGARLVIDEI